MNNREYIGKRIAEIRQAKGLSIRQLAEASGVNFANIYKIENGKYNVSIDILGKICEALGYHVDIKPNINEVIVTKEEIEELREKIREIEKNFVPVKGSSLDEALKERMSRK
jgi:transcriptional regulator with XRE-family HTH domain